MYPFCDIYPTYHITLRYIHDQDRWQRILLLQSEPLLVSFSFVLTHLYWCLEAIDMGLINGAASQPFLQLSASSNTTERFSIVL